MNKTNDRRVSYNNRRERTRSRSRSRERDFNYEDDDEDDEEEEGQYPRYTNRYNDYDNDEQDYYYEEYDRSYERSYSKQRDETPNSTLMIRGLAPTINENDITMKLSEAGLKAKDIRLMRRKETGVSRGFAFIEFEDLAEAVQWKEYTQGYVDFDECAATLHYSIPKESHSNERGLVQKYDWTCYKCGVNNFKRRDQCFKCGTPREESAANETGDEVSNTPTNCLLLKNLTSNTTEEQILTMIGTLTSLPIKSIRIPKDTQYGVSRCVCFVELHTTMEATQLFTLISSIQPGFIIDDSTLAVAYAKRNLCNQQASACASNAASIALAAAQWTNQTDNNDAGASTSAAAGKTHKTSAKTENLGTVTVNGVVYSKFPLPDTSTYQYDKTSGYYYDPATGLYYDANSHYYYNPTTNSYVYWSGDHQTYLPATENSSSTSTTAKSTSGTTSNESSKNSDKSKEKVDKVKIAKKIAKDMEKWAKTLNQKKDVGKMNSGSIAFAPISSASISASSTGDASNEQLQQQANLYITSNVLDDASSRTVHHVTNEKIIAAELVHLNSNSNNGDGGSSRGTGGGGISSSITVKDVINVETENNDVNSNDSLQNLSPAARQQTDAAIQAAVEAEEARLTDWDKLVCLLCKRQFNSKDKLDKHIKKSDLHKSNLEVLKRSKYSEEELERREQNYRDRAKERRMKYGLPEPVRVNDKYYKEEPKIDPGQAALQTPINSENIGNKMLKAMGWSEGQGLGRKNQGSADLITVHGKSDTTGLGARKTPKQGESYKEAVRRSMQQRFKELS